MKLFSVKESKNINGKKTTITINTEDPQIIKNLLDSVPADKEQKKASSKKDSIKAKVKEVKPKSTAKAKGSKGKATKDKAPAKPKALPAPKKEAKKASTSKGKNGMTLTVVNSNGKQIKVERLDNFHNKETNSLWTVENFDSNYIYLVNYVKKDKWKVTHKYLANNLKKIAD